MQHNRPQPWYVVASCLLMASLGTGWAEEKTTEDGLPYGAPLVMAGDLASNLVAGVDRYLDRQTELSIGRRANYWHRDVSSVENYNRSVEPNRRRLAHILGVRDARPGMPEMEQCGPAGTSAMLGREEAFEIWAVRWRAFGAVHGEGLLLVPIGRPPLADVVALPDADQTPEQLAGLAEGLRAESQYGRILARRGCRVLIPALINRQLEKRQSPHGGGSATLSNREYLYRSAFELGRHLIGYEVQKVLAGVDWLARERDQEAGSGKGRKIGVVGWGEGGLLALCAGALDPRIDAVGVSGYFASRQDTWREPVDRNVFGLLEQFGDAELASLIAPRPLVIEAARGPEVTIPPKLGGAPGRLKTPELEVVKAEVGRARELTRGLDPAARIDLIVSGDGAGPCFAEETGRELLRALAVETAGDPGDGSRVTALRQSDAAARHQRQFDELDRHNQWLLTESPYTRQQFMAKLKTGSLADFEASAEGYRKYLYEEVIGKCPDSFLPPNPRARKAYDEARWTGYEVVLEVFPDVMACGVLLVPKGIPRGERRPVVVCQHGLEGRPRDTIVGDHWAYHDFAARLAERGFIVFAPQNLYLFEDRFRVLQRKANPVKLSLFSIITAQHEQILNWLKTLETVDARRIGFYGLSYGGKTAMRVPALLPGYCLSICSGDFNDWVWKNASTRSPYSYVWTGEYEIFEFDLGSTFNYAEMAALIAPRPFMVERGHLDGVAPDETVAYEFAKVRHLYAARLGLGDRCALEWFVGPHTIHGQGTFAFLHRHLNWPQAKAKD